MGMAVGHYIRRAQTLAEASAPRCRRQQSGHRRFADCHRSGALLRG
jgi:hypothetical protein